MAGPEDKEQRDQWLEQGRWLFAQDCTFLLGVAKPAQIPASELTEVAFVGRSNAGKSSLINALTNRGELARTSVTPGRTQQINFFDLGGRMMLADLPGYGYAKAPKKLVDEWNRLLRHYLRGRAPLRRALVLVDSRHGMKDSDHAMMKMLDETAVSYQVILTKVDKISAKELENCLARTRRDLKKHVAAHPEVLTTSSAKNTGIEELRAELAALCYS